MQLIQVQDQATAREFLQVNVDILSDMPGSSRPLDNDVREVFDPKKNMAVRHGEAARWILKDENGLLLGGIAAFDN